MTIDVIVQIGETMDVKVGDITTRTKLQDLLDGGRFVVLQPTYKLAPVIIKDEPVRFTFFRPNGIYSFNAVFERRYMKGNMALCLFQAVSEVEKNQRRYCYRLPVVLHATIRLVEHEEDARPQEIMAKTVNLSERGVLLSCITRIPKGTVVSVQMRLERNNLMIAAGEVLRCEPPLLRNDPYAIAVQFTNMSKKDQDNIARYIIKRQIIERKSKETL